MRLTINRILDLGSNMGRSQSMYDIEIECQNEIGQIKRFDVRYYDVGNNAEYESHIEPMFKYEMFQNEDFVCALHELLDDVVYHYGTKHTSKYYRYNKDNRSFECLKLKPLSEFTVFDLSSGDEVFNNDTREIGQIVSVRECGNEWIEAFIRWPSSQDETKLNLHDKSYYLLKVA